jgi:hypothetical protein
MSARRSTAWMGDGGDAASQAGPDALGVEVGSRGASPNDHQPVPEGDQHAHPHADRSDEAVRRILKHTAPRPLWTLRVVGHRAEHVKTRPARPGSVVVSCG